MEQNECNEAYKHRSWEKVMNSWIPSSVMCRMGWGGIFGGLGECPINLLLATLCGGCWWDCLVCPLCNNKKNMILLLTCASEETFLGEDLASICQCPIRYKKLVKSNRDALLVFDQIPGGDLLIPWLMQSLCLLPPLYLWIVCSWMFRFRFSAYERLSWKHVFTNIR